MINIWCRRIALLLALVPLSAVADELGKPTLDAKALVTGALELTRGDSSYSEQLTFFQKLRSFDFILLFCILILGVISNLSMYSTDGGEILYHTKSHIVRFFVFFLLFIVVSFLKLNFWYNSSTYLYLGFLILLLLVKFFGLSSSGSQRWLNLFFINLQPSELMKIAIIVCFAKFYHRAQINQINNFKNLLVPMMILVLPILLVVSQPDLGTSLSISLNAINSFSEKSPSALDIFADRAIKAIANATSSSSLSIT